MATSIHHTTSADGTTLGYRATGTGPALVVVHGALTTGQEWLAVAEELASEYTVILPDRRGRGLSGARGPGYGLATEVADLRALLAVAGEGAALFGHSYGAICAAATAAAEPSVAALVLYEPPLPLHGPRDVSAVSRVSAALAAGDGDLALTISLTDVVDVPDATVAALRQGPLWRSMVDATAAFEQELLAINSVAGNLDWLATIEQPTLALLGTASPPRRHEVIGHLVATLPHATAAGLPGQAHYAHVTRPAAVATAVRSFLRAI